MEHTGQNETFVNEAQEAIAEAELEGKATDAVGAQAPGSFDSAITEENLFDLVDSGEISLEEANAFLEEKELADEGAKVAPEEGALENEPAGNRAPFRVFDTQEDYQRAFDNAWNKRYGKMMHENEAKDKEHQSLVQDLGALLGVAPEQAAKELARRRRMLEAQQQGEENPEAYVRLRETEEERDSLKEQLAQQEKAAQARSVVDAIRQQGARISALDTGFSIDEAMRNPEFASVVFSLYQSMPQKAVQIAYDTFYKGANARKTMPGEMQNSVPRGNPQQAPFSRPVEGALSGGIAGTRKPVDFARMSDADILKIQDRALRGEKIQI